MEMKCSKYKSYKSGLIKLQLIELQLIELKSDVFNFSKLSTIFKSYPSNLYSFKSFREKEI